MFLRIIRIGLVVLATTALTGCGRKGPLEEPSSTAPTPPLTALANRVLPTQDSPSLMQPPNQLVDTPSAEKLKQATQNPGTPINGPAKPTNKPFFLDPLL